MRRTRAAVAILAALIWGTQPAVAAHPSTFGSARGLLLTPRLLPHRYHYHGLFVQDSVRDWDGGIKPLIAIDERFGWIEGAQESVTDPGGRRARLSVQLFRSAPGARGDFAQFFTNAHPETLYEPGAQWLGSSPVSGLGNPASIYREQSDASSCPQGLVAGVTYVYGNGIFSVGVCLRTVGEQGARDLARRMMSRAMHH
ncbi:MAG: hypothetical protein ACR2JC_15755 [Chloroflexota bacterium]|nr:MAG: hypothetical protein DLM70_07960 [Chloroflexota bacterium]